MAARRILFVEDHPDALDAMSRLLEMQGFEVTRAMSVREALDEAARGKFDLLICDIHLPDGSGKDLAQKICGEQDIPALAISGSEMDPADLAGSPFKAHLMKPVSFGALEETVRKLIG